MVGHKKDLTCIPLLQAHTCQCSILRITCIHPVGMWKDPVHITQFLDWGFGTISHVINHTHPCLGKGPSTYYSYNTTDLDTISTNMTRTFLVGKWNNPFCVTQHQKHDCCHQKTHCDWCPTLWGLNRHISENPHTLQSHTTISTNCYTVDNYDARRHWLQLKKLLRGCTSMKCLKKESKIMILRKHWFWNEMQENTESSRKWRKPCKIWMRNSIKMKEIIKKNQKFWIWELQLVK